MKRIFLFVIVSCFAGSAIAQKYEYGDPVSVTNSRDVRIGVVVAPTISWMKPTANKSDDRLYIVNSEGSKTGFMWGLMIDYFFAENYGISTGFQVNSTGGKIIAALNPNVIPPTVNNLVHEAYFDYRLQYLELPFGIKLLSDDLGKGVRVFGNIGISAGVVISKKANYEVTFTDGTSFNGKDSIRTVVGEKEKIQGTGITPALLSLNVGAGLEYPLSGKLRLYTGVFFNNGFAPDVTNPKDYDLDYKGNFTDANTRLNNIALRIGIFF